MLGRCLRRHGIGLVNGLRRDQAAHPALIATLATMTIGRGLAYIYSGGTNIAPVPKILRRPAGRPHPRHSSRDRADACARRDRPDRAVAHILRPLGLCHGRQSARARLAGINTERVIIIAFMISGLMSAIAGLLITARFEAGAATAAQGMELAGHRGGRHRRRQPVRRRRQYGQHAARRAAARPACRMRSTCSTCRRTGIRSSAAWSSRAAAALDVYRRSYLEAGMRKKVIATKSGKPPKPSRTEPHSAHGDAAAWNERKHESSNERPSGRTGIALPEFRGRPLKRNCESPPRSGGHGSNLGGNTMDTNDR